MADNDQPSRLEAATVKAEAGSQIVSDFANLPAGQTVATASGNIPTLAGVISTIQDEGDQAAADVRAKADAQVQAAIGTLVKKAGDSMTGLLTLSGNPTANLHASPKQFVDSGDAKALADSKSYTDQKIAAIPSVISKYYESTPTTLAPSQVLTFTHGLGKNPKFLAFNLVCYSSVQGYNVGDVIELPAHASSNAAGVVIYAITYDSTKITVSLNNNIAIQLIPKTGGSPSTISIQAYFNLVARAMA